MVWQLELNLCTSIALRFVSVQQMAAEGKNGVICESEYEAKVCLEFLPVEKMAPLDIHS